MIVGRRSGRRIIRGGRSEGNRVVVRKLVLEWSEEYGERALDASYIDAAERPRPSDSIDIRLFS